MKKFGIITHYGVHNHGAVLQLTALIRVLASKGIEAKALQFEKNYDFIDRSLRAKYQISLKSIPVYLKFIRERGIGNFTYNFRKRKTLERFKHDNNLIGDYYSSSPQLDGVIVGSDEVFALHTGANLPFFGHALPTNNVISYAGSFGPTTINDVYRLHCRAFIASGLGAMKFVSVRDANSAEVVENLLGIRPPIVVDPVLLYGYKDEIASLPTPKIKDYLLIYAYDNRMNNPEEVNAIKDYAKTRGLKILSPGFYHSWCDINVDVDPIRLLAFFKNATEVITDTFHGSVMSIITGAKFAVKTRESNHFKLSNLLAEYGLSDRIFTDWSDLPQVMAPEIDYAKVNAEVERRRDESMAHLDRMLALCTE